MAGECEDFLNFFVLKWYCEYNKHQWENLHSKCKPGNRGTKRNQSYQFWWAVLYHIDHASSEHGVVCTNQEKHLSFVTLESKCYEVLQECHCLLHEIYQSLLPRLIKLTED